MMRILLFLATNLAVVLVASVTLSLLGVDGYMSRQGLDLGSLLVFCFVFGMAGSLISLLMSKKMAQWSTGTQIIEHPRNAQEKWLVDTVSELAQKAGIGMPTVGIFPAAQSNAFATGWNRNDALVAVSAGLLQRMRPEETRAVLAHEIGHVANGDMVTLSLVQGVVNTFVMFFARIAGYAVDRFLSGNSDDEYQGPGIAYYIVSIVAEIVLGIAASAIVMWFSRYREYRADEAGAKLAGAGAMMAALQRLKAEQELPNQMPDTLTAFGINKGQTRSLIEQLFSSHPPLDDRIAALEKIAYR
ncbi:zinc metalloprotease HtpX [Terasakiispira papahanaumokuakeensis]|uniref:Protease HtpX n=1 Tax=Terasakiispira papahanaumokuakeensis TaxID=197479 RepID=A0A1E2VB88_9GAMM|nr:protease HtpX [Terasakiispira papahanaumokuakeensis]ODC03915.1 zinc metalloprotease HtpX [Terasakiispira papahanaumokuakeensis]